MHLYICNTTKQHHDFTYKIPGERQFRLEPIRAGQQVRLPINFPDHIAKEVINQHIPYGLRDASKMSTLKDFVGLCYSIDTPIRLDRIHEVYAHNDVVQEEKAEELRELTATSIAQGISNKMASMGVQVPHTEFELREEEPTKNPQPMAKGYEVTREGVAPRHGGKSSKRSKRK